MNGNGNQEEKYEKAIMAASVASIVVNALLSLAKIVVGTLCGSIAVIGDGVDSSADVVISVVMVITAKIISRKPDRKYVFGYAKAESIATKILSMAVFFAGAQMLVTAVKSLFIQEENTMPGTMAIYVTILSIVCKLAMSVYQTQVGKRLKSSMLIANGINMRNDVITSLSVLAGLAFTFIFHMPVLDSVTAILVSLFIIKSAIGIFMESNIDLMDGVRDSSVYQKIFEAVAMVPGACNPHRVRSRSIGTKYMIDLDIEVDGNLSVIRAHEISQEVEKRIREKVPEVYDIMVHVEPLGVEHQEEVFGIHS